jgi:SAM-dependent methyltransferase
MKDDHSSPITDPYANIVELYDREHDEYDEDLELYLGLLQTIDGPVLEMGAGSGRLLIPIASEGFAITGLDSSAPMLARARTRIIEEGVRKQVTLFEGTMDQAERAPGGPFGLVIFSLNALMHLPSVDEQRRALVSTKASLRPGGHVAIDTMNPTFEQLHHLTSKRHLEASWEDEKGIVTDKWSHRDLYSVDQILDTLLYYEMTSPDGTVNRVRTQFPLRYVFPAELELMLELAGFTDVAVFGGYDLSPLTDDSDRIIVIATNPD